jgi:hypothetical protein
MKNEKKTKQISVKLTPTVYQRIVFFAKKEFRSASQQVEKMLLEHPDMKDIKKKIIDNK